MNLQILSASAATTAKLTTLRGITLWSVFFTGTNYQGQSALTYIIMTSVWEIQSSGWIYLELVQIQVQIIWNVIFKKRIWLKSL